MFHPDVMYMTDSTLAFTAFGFELHSHDTMGPCYEDNQVTNPLNVFQLSPELLYFLFEILQYLHEKWRGS